MNELTDRVLALAGVFQAAGLVQEVAHRGRVDEQAFEASLRSILAVDADNAAAVYGGIQGLRYGLERLRDELAGEKDKRSPELLKYVVTVLHLERKLSAQPELLRKIRTGIAKAQAQSEHFPLTHDNIVAGLADTYLDTVSTLSPRVMVSGEQGYLANPDVANRVRALLLAAIRSAVLWHQRGGRRLQVLFGRRKMLDETERLLAASADSPTPPQ